jgi:outer membrane protein insertion porin family
MNFKHLSLLLLILIASLSFAAPSFTVQKIEIDGLARISERTVLSYLPLKVGEQLTDSKSNKIINALYATQFFSHISLAHTGNTLIVKVEERPVMSSINIIGNKELPKDKLDEALKKMNFVQGAVFDQATLEQVKQALAEQYYSMGRYSGG